MSTYQHNKHYYSNNYNDGFPKLENLDKIEDVLSITDSNELDRMKSLQYQFHCSAYNCLCSLFMRTQTDPKFYLAFLFKDDPSKVKKKFIF